MLGCVIVVVVPLNLLDEVAVVLHTVPTVSEQPAASTVTAKTCYERPRKLTEKICRRKADDHSMEVKNRLCITFVNRKWLCKTDRRLNRVSFKAALTAHRRKCLRVFLTGCLRRT